MQRKFVMAVAAIAAAVAVVAVSATAAGTTNVSCSFKLTSQTPPTATSGVDFGLVTCSPPFGNGVQYDTTKSKFTSKTSGTVTGPFTDYFDTGTIHGTFALTVKVTGPKTVTYAGPVKITGGTGAFSKALGTATVSCSSADGGTHTSCTGKETLTSV